MIKLDIITDITIPNGNTWFRLIQGPTFIVRLEKNVDNNTT
jgi:hypothetical protein